MTNSTQEWEAAARARCDAATEGPWEEDDRGISDPNGKPVLEGFDNYGSPEIDWYDHDAEFIAHARTDLPRSLDENQRLRDQLIGAWTHTSLKCPCSPRQLDGDRDPAPWQECTCGLKEALYG